MEHCHYNCAKYFKQTFHICWMLRYHCLFLELWNTVIITVLNISNKHFNIHKYFVMSYVYNIMFAILASDKVICFLCLWKENFYEKLQSEFACSMTACLDDVHNRLHVLLWKSFVKHAVNFM